jgi:NTP pyrophosphatase (non-canonical NTP hydrolase)
MEMDDYQRLAAQTIVLKDKSPAAKMVPLLGLAGEVGELLTQFKKSLRDGDAYTLFPEMVNEELGDILWYVAAVAHQEGFTLSEIAEHNIRKVTGRWKADDGDYLPGLAMARFDSAYPKDEQLPREFTAVIDQVGGGPNFKVHVEVNGESYGQVITDNAPSDDGYRFHDVFHLAYMALLGWSPVSRKNLDIKRRSDARVDEVEDGGRAIVIEEGISAVVFQYAEGRDFLRGATAVEYDLLRVIKRMTKHLEVSACSPAQWQHAILEGYRVWRQVCAHKGGTVKFDGRTLSYLKKQ